MLNISADVHRLLADVLLAFYVALALAVLIAIYGAAWKGSKR